MKAGKSRLDLSGEPAERSPRRRSWRAASFYRHALQLAARKNSVALRSWRAHVAMQRLLNKSTLF